jgi:peptide deformylase
MAIRKVARLGHPVLRRIAEPVPPESIGSPEVQQLIADLIETMHEYDGAGLAAPQIHVPKQVVVFGVAGNPRYPDADEIPLTVLINPRVSATSDALDEDWEGCLSVPDLRGMVPRYMSVAVEAYDHRGQRVQFEAFDFHARVVQHECDHLIGKVFIDRMRSMDSLTFVREFVRYQGGSAAAD